ncbi:MAG: TolC family protein [Bacteroidales bacterium]|nr:TolC family protein [Bacteroidales bacterium]
MKFFCFKLILILTIFINNLSLSQDTIVPPSLDLSDSLLNVPTLDIAIEKALEKSPLLKSADINTAIRQFELKSIQKEWLDDIGIESYYKYGSMDNVNIQNIGQTDDITSAKTTDSRYSVGVYLKMSFLTFLDQKNQNNIARQQIEVSRLERQQIHDEIRKLVIKQYNEYQLNKQLIIVKNKAFTTTQMQLTKTNNDQKNGNLTIYELTKVMEASTKAEADYLKAKMDFRISYLILMELIGEINKVNLNQPSDW